MLNTMLSSITRFAATESAQAESPVDKLGIDPLAIIFQGATFLLLFWIVKRYALDTILRNLEDRRSTIQEGLQNAHKAELRLRESQEAAEKHMVESRLQAKDIIARSHEEAGSIVANAQQRAQQQADEIISQGKIQVEQERQAMRQSLKGELLSLVAVATESLIDEKVTTAKDQAIIEKMLEKGAQ